MFKIVVIIADIVLGGLMLLNLIFDGAPAYFDAKDVFIITALLFVNVAALFWNYEAKDLITLYFRRKALEQQKKIDDLKGSSQAI
ncbi:hypothetical protein HYW59_03250 [Candidatus Kaiserbacteria bacterium]|nr:hypothetical protein [Candidatus Kaiserbacteria bacterium]